MGSEVSPGDPVLGLRGLSQPSGKRLAHSCPSFQLEKESSSYPPCISQSTWEEGSPAGKNQWLVPNLDPAAFPSWAAGP